MTEETFQKEIKRLQEIYGPKLYPAPRLKIFWDAFRHEDNYAFSQAITHCIAMKKTAPMFQDISEALIQTRKEASMRRFQPLQGNEIGDMMNHAAKANTKADPDFVKMCMDQWSKFLRREKPTSELFKECDDIQKLAELIERKKRNEKLPIPPSISYYEKEIDD